MRKIRTEIQKTAKIFRSWLFRRRERQKILLHSHRYQKYFDSSELQNKLGLIEEALHEASKRQVNEPDFLWEKNYLDMLFQSKLNSCWFGFPFASGGSLLISTMTYYINGAYGNPENLEDFSIYHHNLKSTHEHVFMDSHRISKVLQAKNFNEAIQTEFFFCGHEPAYKIPLLGQFGKVLLSIRDVYAACYSTARHHSRQSRDEVGPRELVSSLERISSMYVDWYNQWGHYLKNAENEKTKIIHFEDLKKRPFEVYPKIIEFLFEIPVDEVILRNAISSSSLSAEKARYEKARANSSVDSTIPKNPVRIGYKGSINYDDEMPAQFKSAVDEVIISRLNNDGLILAQKASLSRTSCLSDMPLRKRLP